MKKNIVLTTRVDMKQTMSIFKAVASFLGRMIAPWYPMVEKTANSMTTEPKTFTSPKASGAYRRVTIGVSKMPPICDMTGTEVRVSTSEVNDLLPNYFLLLSLIFIKNIMYFLNIIP